MSTATGSDGGPLKEELKQEYARQDLEVTSEDEIRASCVTYSLSCLAR